MVLTVENLSKSFGKSMVFHDISFSVNKGEIVCIRGKSGEGKTTLLRCLTSLETPDKGSIKINNMYLCREENSQIKYAQKGELQAIRQEIGLVFQDFNLFPHMSVMENLMEAPVFLKNDSPDNIRKRALELLKSRELEGKEDS